jgi:hypothetical protein
MAARTIGRSSVVSGDFMDARRLGNDGGIVEQPLGDIDAHEDDLNIIRGCY